MQLLEAYHSIIVLGYSRDDLVQGCQTITRVIAELAEDTCRDHSEI
jgi:hypothetical protein